MEKNEYNDEDEFWLDLYFAPNIREDDDIMNEAKKNPKIYMQMAQCDRFKIEDDGEYKTVWGLIGAVK